MGPLAIRDQAASFSGMAPEQFIGSVAYHIINVPESGLVRMVTGLGTFEEQDPEALHVNWLIPTSAMGTADIHVATPLWSTQHLLEEQNLDWVSCPAMRVTTRAGELPGTESVHGQREGRVFIALTRTLDLPLLTGDLPIRVEPSAWRKLESPLVSSVVSAVLRAIRIEKQQGSPIRSIVLTTFVDPEAEDWEEFVVRLFLECGPDEALRLWDTVSNTVDSLKKHLSPLEARFLNERIAIDVEWD